MLPLSGITSNDVADTLRMTSYLTGTVIASTPETDVCHLVIALTANGHHSLFLNAANVYLGRTSGNKLYAHAMYADSIDEWDISLENSMVTIVNVKDNTRKYCCPIKLFENVKKKLNSLYGIQLTFHYFFFL